MSDQRTPSYTTPLDDVFQQSNASIDTTEPQNDTLVDALAEQTPPNYVFLRNRRPREDELSPSQFHDFKEEMTRIMTTFTNGQQNKYEEISNTLKSLQQITSNIEQNVTLLTSQNEEFQKKIEHLETQAKKDREYIHILEDKVEDLQRASRRTCIELKNVPRKPSENRDDLINMMTCLSNTVNLELRDRDIRDVFRLKARNDKEKSPPIIVELGSTILKTDLLRKSKEYNNKNKCKLQAKHLGLTTSEDTPVYISEQLTAKGARLFFLARDLTRSKKFKYCWTSFGRVFVRKDDFSKIICVQSEAQVHQLLLEM